MRQLAALLGIALLWIAPPALAQTPVSPATTISDIATQLPTNNRAAITAQTLRSVLGEMVSNFMPLGVNKNTSPWQVCAWGTSALCSGLVGTINPSTGVFTASGGTTPGGTSGQIQYNSGAALAGFTPIGDVTVNVGSGQFLINAGVIDSTKLAPGAAVTNIGFTPISVATKGVANGVPSLDASGFVPIGQLPPAIAGGLAFEGNWNANTNSPALVSSVGTLGQYYFVSVSGTTTLNGVSSWTVGDLLLFSSGIWNRIPGSGGSAVTSVAGLGPGDITGVSLISALALTAPNIGAGNFPNANFGFGAAISPDSLVTVNANSGATVAPVVPAQFHAVAAGGASAHATLDSFANYNIISLRRADGTLASKTAVQSGEPISAIVNYGWDGSGYNNVGGIGTFAAQNYTGSASGSFMNFLTTPLNTHISVEAGRFNPSGGFSVGTTTDNGIGTVTANAGFYGDGSHLTGITSPARAMTTIGGNVLPQLMTQDQRDSTQGYISIFNWIPPAQYANIIAGTSTYDATANINTAFATGLPINMCYPATFNITNKITLAAFSKVKGCHNATFHMTNSGLLSFNLGASAVVQLASNAEFSGVIFNFDQPDTTVRASMTHYPPAIGGDGTYTFDAQSIKVDDIVCARAWICLSTIGNVIGTFTNLRLGAFGIGWQMDGTGDFSRYSNIECWWFGFTSNQQIAAAGPGTTCLDIGEGNFSFTNVQAWFGNIIIHVGNAANLFGGGIPIVNFSNLQLDTSYVNTTSGKTTINSVVGTKDGTPAWGTGRHNGQYFVIGAGASTSLIVSGIDVEGNGEQLAYNSGGGFLSLDAGILRQDCVSCPIVQADNGLTTLGAALILAGGSGARSSPAMLQNGGGVSMSATVDRTTAPGQVAFFNTDDSRNFIDGSRYEGMNSGNPIGFAGGFAGTVGAYPGVWFSYTSTVVSCNSGSAPTLSANTDRFTRSGKNVTFTISLVVSATNACTFPHMSLPFTAASDSIFAAIDLTAGTGMLGDISAGASSVQLRYATGSGVITTNTYRTAGQFETSQ